MIHPHWCALTCQVSIVRENACTAKVLNTLWLILYFFRPPFLSRVPESLAYLCVCSAVSNFLRPMGCSLTSSSVHGLSQARLLEWVAISYSTPKSKSERKIFCFQPHPQRGILDESFFEWWSFPVIHLYVLLLFSPFSHVRLFAAPWTVAHQPPLSWDFPSRTTGVGCHFLYM